MRPFLALLILLMPVAIARAPIKDPALLCHLWRLKHTHQWADLWGERWLVLPNPVYGSWLSALGSRPADLLDPSPAAE